MSISLLMVDSVHNAHRVVKAKRTPQSVQNAHMRKILDQDYSTTDQSRRLSKARRERGFEDAKSAATFFGWNYTTYSQHERGERGLRKDIAERYAKALRVSAGWLLTGEGQQARHNQISVMGRIGAGAEILPEFEQISPEGLFEIEADVPLPEGMIGFEVIGDSQYPRYDEGDIIVCRAEGASPEDIPPGAEAAVRTSDGRRFLKRVWPSSSGFTLESHNAPPIHDVGLEWASEVGTVIRRNKWRKLNHATGKITKVIRRNKYL